MEYNFSPDGSQVSLAGQLTFPDHPSFRALSRKLLEGKGSSVVIDLSKLDFIDSAGLGMLLIVRDDAKTGGRSLVLRAPHGQVKKMFDVSKFETLFNIQA